MKFNDNITQAQQRAVKTLSKIEKELSNLRQRVEQLQTAPNPIVELTRIEEKNKALYKKLAGATYDYSSIRYNIRSMITNNK